MPPRVLVQVLGLCNVVAGALVVFGPTVLMPGADGLGTTAARVFGGSLGAFLVGSGIGGWLMPPAAQRPYLWVFAVGVKLVAAVLWGFVAMSSGIWQLWSGAAVDLAVAAVVIVGLVGSGR